MVGLMYVYVYIIGFVKKRKVSLYYVVKDNGNLFIRSFSERKFFNYLFSIKMKVNRSNFEVSFVIVFF